MVFRKIISSALLLFSAYFSIFPEKFSEETAIFGNKLSQSVAATLEKNGYTAYVQQLTSTGQDDFAYNIIVEFDPSLKGNETEQSDSQDISRKEVIFCFTQEDFIAYQPGILDFLSSIKAMERTWTARILFSALDTPPKISHKAVNGTEVFAASIDDSDSSCVIVLSFDPNSETSIYTGSYKNTTPLWLTKQISDAFYDEKRDFSFENIVSAIYRLGIVRGQERLSYFFINDIPSIEIHFSDYTGLSVLKKFSENYTADGSGEWDKHYLYINRSPLFRAVFISERTIIITCLSVGLFTIFLLCAFSFIGENGERHKYEFQKSSYMIPFTVSLSFLSLVLGQHIVSILSSFFQLNPIVLYGIKIVFSMIFISALFTVQGILKISVTAFMYGYLLLVVAIFNIFLFSAQDLTLFVIFALEYIIIYVSRSAKRLPSLIVYFFLMFIPFLPHGFIIIRQAEDIELMRTVFATPVGNLMLALGLFPFQITWLRMLVLLNVQAGIKGYTMKKIILNGFLSTIVILAFISLVIFLISHFIYRPYERAAGKIETKIVREEKFTLSAKLSKNEFSGMNTNHISISSEEDALRYEVTLRGIETAHPIYDSIYKYTLITDSQGNDSYVFVVPDYPPRQITIDYAAPAIANASIEITAYYRTEEANTFRSEKRELKVE